MLYLYIYLILKTDNAAWSAWVSQNLPWVGWRDETISQIERARARVVERERALCNPYYMMVREWCFLMFWECFFFGFFFGSVVWGWVDYVISVKMLKNYDEDVKLRDFDRKERVSGRERKTERCWYISPDIKIMPPNSILMLRQDNMGRQQSECNLPFRAKTPLFSPVVTCSFVAEIHNLE